MRTMYAHFRLFNGQAYGDDSVEPLIHSGGVTCCAYWDEQQGSLNVGYTVCSGKDTYDYNRGRTIAEGRLQEKYDSTKGLLGKRHPRYVIDLVDIKTEQDLHDALAWVALYVWNGVRRHHAPRYAELRRYYRSNKAFDPMLDVKFSPNIPLPDLREPNV